MGKPRIDYILLDRMLREDTSAKECAAHFSVTESAICQARKKLKAAVVKDVDGGHPKSLLLVGTNLGMATTPFCESL